MSRFTETPEGGLWRWEREIYVFLAELSTLSQFLAQMKYEMMLSRVWPITRSVSLKNSLSKSQIMHSKPPKHQIWLLWIEQFSKMLRQAHWTHKECNVPFFSNPSSHYMVTDGTEKPLSYEPFEFKNSQKSHKDPPKIRHFPKFTSLNTTLQHTPSTRMS